MKLKYKGATGIFNGKLFIHGLNYDVEIIGKDFAREWTWLRIGKVEIPYSKKGLEEVWGIDG